MTHPPGRARLAAETISFAYAGREALRAISLSAAGGEILGVLGPNGSGKTTLLRCLLGFLRPDAGRVTLDGADVSRLPRRELARRMAAVPQEMPTDFPLRVDELVLLGRLPYLPHGGLGFESAADLEAAERALQACGVADLRDRLLHQLSGGELRRAFIARALAQLGAPRAESNGRVLLLDEPTSGLDLRHQEAVLDLLRAEARAGTAVVLVLHDVSLAAAACDRVALLKEGALVDEGAPGAVLTAATLTSVYEVGLEVLTLPGETARIVVQPAARRSSGINGRIPS
jgi:iron complex transport system ATP-binding protein